MPARSSRQPHCPNFRRLVDNVTVRSHLSIRALEYNAGLAEKRIGQYYSRRERLNEPPPLRICATIAKALTSALREAGEDDEVTANQVWYALSLDSGLLPEGQARHKLTDTEVERELRIRQMGEPILSAIDRMLMFNTSGG